MISQNPIADAQEPCITLHTCNVDSMPGSLAYLGSCRILSINCTDNKVWPLNPSWIRSCCLPSGGSTAANSLLGSFQGGLSTLTVEKKLEIFFRVYLRSGESSLLVWRPGVLIWLIVVISILTMSPRPSK